LINGLFEPKISDFGTSLSIRSLPNSQKTNGFIGTPQTMAPEVLLE